MPLPLSPLGLHEVSSELREPLHLRPSQHSRKCLNCLSAHFPTGPQAPEGQRGLCLPVGVSKRLHSTSVQIRCPARNGEIWAVLARVGARIQCHKEPREPAST